jgi:hypothetical protein
MTGWNGHSLGNDSLSLVARQLGLVRRGGDGGEDRLRRLIEEGVGNINHQHLIRGTRLGHQDEKLYDGVIHSRLKKEKKRKKRKEKKRKKESKLIQPTKTKAQNTRAGSKLFLYVSMLMGTSRFKLVIIAE